MILEYGKIPYQDKSVQQYFGKSWPEAKGELLPPFGQLPLLDVDGTVIAQEAAISRYCASLVPGLLPEDPLLLATCDAIFHAAEELASSNPIVNVFRGEQFEEKKKEYLAYQLPRRLANFARLIEKSGGPFTQGATPTYADFKLYHHLSNTRLLDPAVLNINATIPAFMKAVESLPGIKEYLGSRPEAVDVGTSPMLKPPICGSRFEA